MIINILHYALSRNKHIRHPVDAEANSPPFSLYILYVLRTSVRLFTSTARVGVHTVYRGLVRSVSG